MEFGKKKRNSAQGVPSVILNGGFISSLKKFISFLNNT